MDSYEERALVQRASAFAVHAHDSVGQVRKGTNEPYWTHPARVAAIIEEFGGDMYQVSAGWLHDTIEDVDWVTPAVLDEKFGSDGDIVPMVVDVTDPPKEPGVNRAERKRRNAIRISMLPFRSLFVKLGDTFGNLSEAHTLDADFRRIYVAEKRCMFDLLPKSGPSNYMRLYGELGKLLRTMG
jgi:guanosine-3',5'-bis(diphosphate) 3'-pyrophosphohydrolase